MIELYSIYDLEKMFTLDELDVIITMLRKENKSILDYFRFLFYV